MANYLSVQDVRPSLGIRTGVRGHKKIKPGGTPSSPGHLRRLEASPHQVTWITAAPGTPLMLSLQSHCNQDKLISPPTLTSHILPSPLPQEPSVPRRSSQCPARGRGSQKAPGWPGLSTSHRTPARPRLFSAGQKESLSMASSLRPALHSQPPLPYPLLPHPSTPHPTPDCPG